MATAQFVPLSELPAVPDTIPGESGQSTVNPVDNSQYVTGFEPPPEGGSETVANFLKKLEPSVDTRIPESATQAAARINRLIEQGHYDSALREIAKLKKGDNKFASPGTDVQLLFLEGRAYAAKGDAAKAVNIYREMTFNYPELAEPWNNLAVVQMKFGSLDEALTSLQTALTIRPSYAIANQNIGLIYALLAKQSFDKAASQGAKGARAHAQQLQQFLNRK
ncbi:MAG: tetratricopeptide repeat protein [Pelistega sp.]|nr:tetratricopeptide repeat protein [Pelistega sp.]